MVEFKIPLYGGTVKVFNNKDEFNSEYGELELEELNMEGFKGVTQKIFLEDESLVFMVGVFDGKINTLAHECTHVGIYIADHTGWVINDNTSEPFCYLVDYILEQSLPVLKD